MNLSKSIKLSFKRQLYLLDRNPKYLVNSRNTYLTAVHLACKMGGKLILTFGISKDFKSYIKDYYKNRENLVPSLTKKIYVYHANKERSIFENYVSKRFKVKIYNY